MDYFIRQTKPNQYEIAKFDELRSSPPEQYYTYKVIGDTCTCPSYEIPCKHIHLIRRWLALKIPVQYFYRDTTDTFIEHDFGDAKHLRKVLKRKTALKKKLCPQEKPIRKTLKT